MVFYMGTVLPQIMAWVFISLQQLVALALN